MWRNRDYTPVIATEIEFYLPCHPGEGRDPVAVFIERLKQQSQDKSWLPAFAGMTKERGENQWEVSLHPQRDVSLLIQQTETLKASLIAQGADFSAKPFPDRPGSGLHIHVHLEDASGANVYYKKDAEISDALKWSISGLLATMRDYLPVFVPTESSRARFQPGGNAPTTISWGANNRTVAVRLPDIGAPRRHIEHRVAGADADIGKVVEAVLAGIAYGLEHRSDPGPQTYGDASDAQYALEKLFP